MAITPVPGVTVFCDPSLHALLTSVGARAGYQVAVLSAPAPLMLAQIERHTRNDVLITQSASMDRAAAQGMIDDSTRVDGFATPLVLAGTRGWDGDVTKSRVAVTDDTVISGLDGRAVLAANAIAPAAVQGAASTADVAFLVLSGGADAGLLYLTDVRAEPRLVAGRTLDSVKFSAAVNAKSGSPNAKNFIAFLRNRSAALNAGGLRFS